MNDFRAVFPTQIVRGAVLRPDGIAVGVVSGGAPSWDLLSQVARGEAGEDYHRLLLALDLPIDIYLIDQPPDVAGAIGTLLERQEYGQHPLLAAVLSETADYLAELAQQSASRAKQVIWTVTAGGEIGGRGVGGLDLGTLIGRSVISKPNRRSRSGSQTAPTALAQVIEKARRLSDALSQLGGTPAPRLMEAEEITRLIYGLADPVRAQRYPLAGTLLDRLRRVITPTS